MADVFQEVNPARHKITFLPVSKVSSPFNFLSRLCCSLSVERAFSLSLCVLLPFSFVCVFAVSCLLLQPCFMLSLYELPPLLEVFFLAYAVLSFICLALYLPFLRSFAILLSLCLSFFLLRSLSLLSVSESSSLPPPILEPRCSLLSTLCLSYIVLLRSSRFCVCLCFLLLLFLQSCLLLSVFEAVSVTFFLAAPYRSAHV